MSTALKIAKRKALRDQFARDIAHVRYLGYKVLVFSPAHHRILKHGSDIAVDVWSTRKFWVVGSYEASSPYDDLPVVLDKIFSGEHVPPAVKTATLPLVETKAHEEWRSGLRKLHSQLGM